ncbi:glycosyltransferase family 2 protein [Palaeococcus ferrophilus]|uniref:glycosyltransferase family 2 protein n=1 Tax=Palaeococcus ferrophilus TaxID=83868 RepID=UPI00064EF414|nr:glycosyltransferase family A protein [Palaeococcus ferrophilus]
MNDYPLISLILATKGRDKEVEEFLDSLLTQTYKNFEIIIVDQNPDNRIEKIIQKGKYEDLKILHLRSSPGLSKARNTGLRHTSGDIVGFPDDDCRYPPTLLEHVVTFFLNHPEFGGVSGKIRNQSGQSPIGHLDKKSGRITLYNVWKRGVSTAIFLRREVVLKVGYFDEDLGVGAKTKWQSGEETDYLIRAIKKGFNLYYDPGIEVYHPLPFYKSISSQRAYGYGGGMGRVLYKHKFPLWFVFLSILNGVFGIILGIILLNMPMIKFYIYNTKGRLLEYLSNLGDSPATSG